MFWDLQMFIGIYISRYLYKWIHRYLSVIHNKSMAGLIKSIGGQY